VREEDVVAEEPGEAGEYIYQGERRARALEKDAGDFESLSHERKDQTQV
jgi:hypothetical protein